MVIGGNILVSDKGREEECGEVGVRGFEYRNSYCIKDIANPRRHC